MNSKQQLLEKIKNRTAVIGIIGLGYVGLLLTIRFGEAGFRVIGFDIDPGKAEQLNRGESYIGHIPAEKIAAARETGFEATSDYSRSAEADALLERVKAGLEQAGQALPAMFKGGALVGANPRLRLYRYQPGQRHGTHWDTEVELEGGRVRSRLTLVLYLNDDFSGGQTRFEELDARKTGELIFAKSFMSMER